MTLMNRFVRSATREFLASSEGRFTDQYFAAYNQLAEGKVGLIIPGSYYVHKLGRTAPGVTVLDEDGVTEDLQILAQNVHNRGAKIVGQVNHGGRQADPRMIKTTPIGPSAVRDKRSMIKPRPMDENEIEETIKAYGTAARRLREGGFDGVQIHAAHGYLINQFLSGYTNHRKDRWGGSLENRMRFLMEVFNSIRSQVGADFPILIKINAEDHVKGGVTIEETIFVCQKLEELGIAAIEISGGIGETGLSTSRGGLPEDLVLKNRSLLQRLIIRLKMKSLRTEARFHEAYYLPFAAAVKKRLRTPIIAVGGIRRRLTMEQALKTGQADFIALCRPFIRQPHLVKLMEKGHEDPITCTNCNRCTLEMLLHHKPMGCYCREKKAFERNLEDAASS